MPRYEENVRDRRRRLSTSHSPVHAYSRRAKDDDDDSYCRRFKDDRSDVKYSRWHSRSPTRSPRREHRSYRRRSRSRGYDDTTRRRDNSRSSAHQRRPRNRGEYDDGDRPSKSQRSVSSSRARSPPRQRSRSLSPRFSRRSKNPLPSQKDTFSKTPIDATSMTSTTLPEKEKPNFANTGLLAAETNTVKSTDGLTSVVLKYHEPPEARKPPARDPWRLYVFKGEDLLETIPLGGRSCWLIGRERLVVDLPVDHPSCSKQHAALQFRYVEKRNEYGDRDGRVRPYLIDLESANGSTVNGELSPTGRYMELMDKDVLKFGFSTREYVLMLPPSGR
ncbi:uncharacterized protein PADG_00647 [Paracoccidioides brasiliensis Pb18]|uniref:FHA domain-containing protein n=1 Tax=Paracoccidioides brasiliensis (strain Pb18) TaxID=502780 RepID=C1G1A7_PARBD|nr:uncharacterized protein PADG_00647 [Paracoccidioides brasiliensis Pb18]EEH44358.2 hypothetical protein PADG_00647 [Paracoccidioides brasiliensis Pb18]